MKIYTIGFTKKTAEQFFETRRASGAKRLVDVRLNNVSQLAGFAKKQDLAYFLGRICGLDYVHLPLLAPTQDILDEYKKLAGLRTGFSQPHETAEDRADSPAGRVSRQLLVVQ
jgi:hypothetical protein